MSVRKLPNGKWKADKTVGYKADGSPNRRTKVCDDEGEARYWEHVFVLQSQDPKAVEPSSITFKEFVEGVFWPMKESLSANTLRGYERDVRLRLMPAFANMPIDSINSYHIQMMLNECPTRKIAQNARGTLSSILSAAQGLELIDRNPALFGQTHRLFQYPAASEKEGTQYGEWLSNYDEHLKLLGHLERHHKGDATERLVVLGLCFGLRPQETIALDWEQVDLKAGFINVIQACIHSDGDKLAETKTRSNRRIPIDAMTLNILSRWERNSKETTNRYGKAAHSVVATRFGTRMHSDTMRQRIQKLRKEAYDDGSALPAITQESLRHSFATAGIRAGVPVATMSAWLGHSNIITTYNRYVKVAMKDIESDIDIVSRAKARVCFEHQGS